MFTLQDIKAAHSKVKSGADFPAYVQELKQLGMSHYENQVSDGHSVYYGNEGFQLSGEAKYAPLPIAEVSSTEQLKQALHIHQQGQTDYPTFCHQAAEAGVEKWVVQILALTCTYYNSKGEIIIEEQIST